MQEEKKYIGYGYHGGGRPKKDDDKKRVVLQISGSPDDIKMIKEAAATENKTVSRYLLDLVKSRLGI